MEELIEIKESKFKKKLIKVVPYIYYFFTFAFLGWIVEVIYCFGVTGQFTNRGFLYSPLCPIYGYGALIITVYLDNLKEKNENKNYFKILVIFTVVLSFFEYFVGFALEALFSLRWWDYSEDTFNINGRITLVNSIIWGVAAVLFARFIYPVATFIKDKLSSKVPFTIQAILASTLVIAIITDTIISSIHYLSK